MKEGNSTFYGQKHIKKIPTATSEGKTQTAKWSRMWPKAPNWQREECLAQLLAWQEEEFLFPVQDWCNPLSRM
ncbi:MAG: hypothetical protein NTZ13_04890 [Candidatus Parcubacteria bacterium]|nr:hypothetical protein [Candidatus Parcubacteria bacterium]